MPLNLRISSGKLSVLAMFIWLCSLLMTGITFYTQHRLLGYEILAMGWLSPLVGNFAWFANAFFILGFILLIGGDTATKSSILAALFSLDTFRFTAYLLNEGGTTTPVYGYGWGAILWFLSIFLLLTAAGARQLEARKSSGWADERGWLRLTGLILFVATLALAVYFSVHDRMVANPTEAKHLEGIAFKRGCICRAPEPTVIEPIRSYSGPLEVVVDEKALHANYPFAQIKDMLEWGIPIVRVKGLDYSMDSTSPGKLISVSASGRPSAVLHITEGNFNSRRNSRSIRAKLVDATSRTVFDQMWTREPLPNVNDNYYCPDYLSFPRENEQPRKLLMQALNLTLADSGSQEVLHKQNNANMVDGVVVGHADGGLTRKMRIARWMETNPDSKSRIPVHEMLNTNCPSDIGWDDRGFESRQNTGRPFMVKGKAYYLPSNSVLNATCAGDLAYLYTGRVSHGTYYLDVQKRTLPEFRQMWAGIVLIQNVTATTYDGTLKIQSLTEENDSITIELVNDGSGEIIFVKAPLHVNPPRQ